MDPFIEKTFAKCLVNGLRLLIVFTNEMVHLLLELLVLKVALPSIFDTDIFCKTYYVCFDVS